MSKSKETYIDRLQLELSELTSKIEKLTAFIVKGGGVKYPTLKDQLKVMTEYSDILKTRLG